MKGTDDEGRKEILISPERGARAKPRTQLITYVTTDRRTYGMGNPFYPKGKSLMMAAAAKGIDEGK